MGDWEKKRIEHDYLTEDSLVFCVGGYKGVFESKLYNKYKCNIFIFEPVKMFYDELVNKFNNEPKVKIFNFGLFSENKKCYISVNGDGSSIHQGKLTTEIELVDIVDFLDEKHVDKIDLMEINIEGSEFRLMNRLIDSGKISTVKNIQLQYHKFIDDSETKRNDICDKLKDLGWERKWNWDFVWEYWSHE